MGPKLLNNEVGRRSFDPQDQLLLTLWILATPESFRAVGERFGIERGNSNRIFYRVVDAINELSSTFIKWPNQMEMTVCFHSKLKNKTLIN